MPTTFSALASMPMDLIQSVDIAKVVQEVESDAWGLLQSFYRAERNRLQCVDVISGQMQSTWQSELQTGAKLAFLAFLLPWYWTDLCTQTYLSNAAFLRLVTATVAETSGIATEHMNQLLQGEVDQVILPDHTRFSGFYLRTRIRVFDRHGQRREVFRIPAWENRQQLLTKHQIHGGLHVYVLRENLETGYQCLVLFRGTTSEFTGLPQYGVDMKATQIYQVPSYHWETRTTYQQGSDALPLFLPAYCHMIDDVWPDILSSLEVLQVRHPQCVRLLVCGHSLGGALVQAMNWKLWHADRTLWQKTDFRSFAAPMIANHAAILVQEQRLIDHDRPLQYMDVVNTDDFVNSQYLLGGKSGVEASIRAGTEEMAAWLAHQFLRRRTSTISAADIWREQTEAAMGAFFRGAMRQQQHHPSMDKRSACRLGQRPMEMQHWGDKSFSALYHHTLLLVYCERPVDWTTEYLGKAHAAYCGMNFALLWTSLRFYEDQLYRSYAKHSLKHRNEHLIIPLFHQADMQRWQARQKTSPPNEIKKT